MVTAQKIRVFGKNTLRGLADFELTETGIVLCGCPVHEKNGNRWVGMPGRPYTDTDGAQQWTPTVKMPPHVNRAFQRQAIRAVEAHTAQTGERVFD
jgi:hypothetical protein